MRCIGPCSQVMDRPRPPPPPPDVVVGIDDARRSQMRRPSRRERLRRAMQVHHDSVAGSPGQSRALSLSAGRHPCERPHDAATNWCRPVDPGCQAASAITALGRIGIGIEGFARTQAKRRRE